jgi:hypothetical protein
MEGSRLTVEAPTTRIRFKARLQRPAEKARDSSWAFLVLPKAASAKLPTRSMTTVDGTLNGHPFRATLEPDGKKSHWLKVNKRLRDAAGANSGDSVTVEIRPAGVELESRVPTDLRKALAASAKARALWSEITPIARRDWIQWITSAKRPETRTRRVENACKMLAGGKRRVCCFDRSGYYGGNASAPKAAE